MRISVALPLLLGLIPISALADVRERAGNLEFFSPQVAWAVAIPKNSWRISDEKRRSDAVGYYYMLEAGDGQPMALSLYIDRTTDCSSGESCRERFWANRGSGMATAHEVQRFERNGFHIIQFTIDFPDPSASLKQMNASAHIYKDGYWIDVRVSLLAKEPDPAALLKVIDSLSVQ